MKLRLLMLLILTACLSSVFANLKPLAPRQVLNLDGVWEIEQGGLDSPPASFTHTVPVPGLVDLAKPAFAEVGKKSGLRQAFWYRRTFRVPGEVPDLAILKIHKARYGTKVWLNGQLVGEHLPCFTPAYLDVKPQLKGGGQPNELLIRVGADRESLPPDMPSGWDFEKYLFLPGIYDSVELILTGAPYIANLQLAPDLQKQSVRLVAEIIGGDRTEDCYFTAKISPAGSRTVAGEVVLKASVTARQMTKVDVTIPIQQCRLWTPENPHLYEVTVSTIRDAARTRFGMRSFAFDPATQRALLNGKPYYLRGSNITLYRFFEDAARGELPWDRAWVRKLHQKLKTMHWNSLRYCIGFPPEFWYEIADEEGILIQDEFPIWLLGKAPENPTAGKIIPEYTEWMRERWNHPCVVIWDAQNESNTPETGKAIQAVRHLDLSQRPFENGWAAPQSLTDCVESHPYLFIRAWSNQRPFRLQDMPTVSGKPHLNAEQSKLPVAVIINEYCWLWLTRDGNPTCLTDKVYEGHLGTNSTPAQRRQMHARYVAALTEFWRCHREAAGVLHFCSLGYSRPGDKPRPEGGATSDDFIDLRALKFEPKFEEYVKEAFNPVGLMLDFWAEEAPAGARQSLKVYVINDIESVWKGTVRLGVIQGGRKSVLQTQKCAVAPLGREILTFEAALPSRTGPCTLFAELTDPKGKTIRSLRDLRVK